MKKLFNYLLIRKDEQNTVLYFFSLFFIIGCGMAMGKTSADALFFKRFGIQHLPFMYIALGILLTVVSLLYAAFADRISAEKFFSRLFIILITLLISVWSLINYVDSAAIYPFYYLIYETSSEVILIHMALYLNQNLDTFKSKRLLPVILGGSQLGLITGGILVAIFAPLVGTSQIILIWCLLLLITIIMMTIWHKINGSSAYFYKTRTKNTVKDSLQAVKQGIKFTRNSNLLRASSLAFFFLVITFYTLYYVTNQVYTDFFNTEDELVSFFGILTAVTGLLALLLQLFISNRGIDKFGIKNINLIFPVSVTLGFVALFISLKMPSAIFGSLIKNAIYPAFSNPVRNMMFNILPKHIQTRSRAVSIGIILPLALLVCAVILISTQYLNNNYYYLAAGIISSLLLLYFSVKMNRAYLKTLILHLKEQVYLPSNTLSETSSISLLKSLEDNILQTDDEVTISCAKILIKSDPKKACVIIIKKIQTTNSKTADQLVRIMAGYTVEPLRDCLLRPDKYPEYDHHFDATLLQLLFEARDSFAKKYVLRALISDNARVWATGVYGAINYEDTINLPQANKTWLKLSSGTANELLAALPLAALISKADHTIKTQLVENYEAAFLNLLNSDIPRWQLLTMDAMTCWQAASLPNFSELFRRLITNTNPFLRAAVIRCSYLLEYHEHMDFLVNGLEDGHADVRNAALNSLLVNNNEDTDTVALNWLVNNDSFTSPRAQLTILEYLLKNGLTESCLLKIADAKSDIGRYYYDALQILKPHQHHNRNLNIIYCTIEERLQQVAVLLLAIIEQLDLSNIMPVVSAAIKSTDKQLIATACEALQNIKRTQISALLIDILQDNFELKTNYILRFDNIDDTLNWCTLQDQWLQTCALRAQKND